MSLPAAAASIEDIDEKFRDFYTENEEGVFVLDVTATEMQLDGRPRYYNLEDVGGLRATLNEVKSKRDSLQTKLGEYGEISALEAKKLKGKVEEFSQLDPEKEAERLVKAKVEGITSNMQNEFDAALNAANERQSVLRGQLESELITAQAVKAIAESKGSVELLLGVVKERTRMKESESGFEIEVLDATGNPDFTYDGNHTRPKTIPELVRGLKENTAYSRAFDATGNSGSESSSSATKQASRQSMPDPDAKVVHVNDLEAMGDGLDLEAMAKGELTVDFSE